MHTFINNEYFIELAYSVRINRVKLVSFSLGNLAYKKQFDQNNISNTDLTFVQ